MRRRLLLCMGGGVVEGLLDSKDIEPRVRLGVLLGASVSLEVSFLSKSLELAADDEDVLVCECVLSKLKNMLK